MCVCVCVPRKRFLTVEVIIIKLGMVTAAGMVMHHVLIVLMLTFIQGDTDLNYQSDNLALRSRSQLRLKLDIC